MTEANTPWKVVANYPDDHLVVDAKNEIVADGVPDEPTARLFANAPALYDLANAAEHALRALLAYRDGPTDEFLLSIAGELHAVIEKIGPR